MAFFNASLLLGGLLMTIPVIVHLALRRQPTRQIFPALQFLLERRETNRRHLQLRHWLLLLLRCAVIGLLALALARPSVPSLQWGLGLAVLGGALLWLFLLAGLLLCLIQRRSPFLSSGLAAAVLLLGVLLASQGSQLWASAGGQETGDRRAPVSALFVIDTSPRMLYRSQNQTRLDVARQMAGWLFQQLPAGSQVAVVESRPGQAVFAVDAAAAERAIQRVQAVSTSGTMTQAVRRALQLAESSEWPRREMYVLTDLTRAAWPAEELEGLESQLAALSSFSVYVIDVGVVEPENSSLGDVRLSAEAIASRGALELHTAVHREGAPTEVDVELYLERPSEDRPVIVDGQRLLPEAELRGQQTVQAVDGSAQGVQFRLRNLPPGTHQGYLRLRRPDHLTVDDRRYFAVQVRPPWPILVVAPPDVTSDFFIEALAPFEYRQTDQARFDCKLVPQNEWAGVDLSRYAAVCLLDPLPMAAADWQRLHQYVRQGGGLAFFLGHHTQPATDGDPPLRQSLLAGRPVRQWRTTQRDLFLAPAQFDHPILAAFRAQATSVPWSDAPIFRHWVLEDLPTTAQVVIPFSNGRPALIEQEYGQGRVLTFTTPVSDAASLEARQPWNELPTSENAWPYVVLANEMLTYLVQDQSQRLNYLAGETATLPNDQELWPTRYQLFPPEGSPLDVTAQGGRLQVGFTEQLGAYRLKGFAERPVVRGFAVNLPARTTRLARVPQDELQTQLGPQVRFAQTRDEVHLEVGQARAGYEFYPMLCTLLVLLVGLEQLFANRFYPESA